MPIFHQQTKHSFISVRKNAFFLDWRSQPKNTKHYPHFYQRFNIADYEELKDLELLGSITYKQETRDGEYYLRSVPSAGALYPCEVYLQIRGVKGLISGIYHYEPFSGQLSLLAEIEKDGVEFSFGDKRKQKGIIFLVSAVYFRSSWKYRDRSIRYILLDSGHQLGGIYAYLALHDKFPTALFDFDKLALNEKFGFREDEMFTVGASLEEFSEKESRELRTDLPFVSGSDYLETNESIERAYKESATAFANVNLPNFFDGFSKEELKEAIKKRRSIRAFRKEEISKNEYEKIVSDLFSFAKENGIDIFYTLHRVDEVATGLYKNGELVKEGDFSEKSKYLSLEQNIGGDSAVTFYFTSKSVEEYQKVNILSGFIAHIIYLRSEVLGIGTTGIGAYYDDEVKEFLNTPNNVLYLLAIGK